MIITESILRLLETFVQKRFWKAYSVFLLASAAIFFAFPSYNYLPQVLANENWEALMTKKAHPLQLVKGKAESAHAGKKNFRLTIPIIAKIAHLDKYGLLVFQFLIGLCMIYLLIALAEQITSDKVTALLFASGAAFVYFGRACFLDIYSWFDGCAFFFLIAAMFFKNPVAVFVFSSLAAWTDERGFMGVSAVILFHFLSENFRTPGKGNVRAMIAPACVAGFAAMSAYLALRYYLSEAYGLHVPSEGANFSVLSGQMEFLGIGSFTHLEGFWILLLSAIVLLFATDKRAAALALIAIAGAFTIVSYMVWDITRGGSYFFSVIPVALLVNAQHWDNASLRKLLLACAVVCWLFPAYYVQTDLSPYVMWYKPLFIKALKFFIAGA